MVLTQQLRELLTMAMDAEDYYPWELKRAAIYVLNEVNPDNGWLDKVRNDPDHRVRIAAVQAFHGRDVPFKWIEEAFEDDIPFVRVEAVKNMFERKVLLSMIERVLDDECYLVRLEGVYLCAAHIDIVPPSLVSHLQNSDDKDIRTAARNLLPLEE